MLPPQTLMRHMADAQGHDRRDLACAVDLLTVAAATQDALGRFLAGQRLSASKFRILCELRLLDGQSPSSLAACLGVRRPTLTGLLDNLEADGCVRRRPVPGDRRRLRAELTERGRSLADAGVATLSAHMARTLAPLNLAQRATLRKLLAALDAAPPSAEESAIGAGVDP